jgi:hypothetical protein
MKKLLLSVSAITLLSIGSLLYADAKVILMEKPVILKKEGQMYVVPEGSTTTSYYTYTTDAGELQYCAVTAPTELMSVNGTLMEVKMDGATKQVKCYPATYFELNY